MKMSFVAGIITGSAVGAAAVAMLMDSKSKKRLMRRSKHMLRNYTNLM